jgi:hypothetical protein
MYRTCGGIGSACEGRLAVQWENTLKTTLDGDIAFPTGNVEAPRPMWLTLSPSETVTVIRSRSGPEVVLQRPG